MREDSPLVQPWREAIVSEAIRQGLEDTRLSGPLLFRATFWHKRLSAHYGSKKGVRYIKDNAPTFVATTPDVDKVQRSTFDGLTQSGVIEDDKFIVVVHVQQRYSNDGFTGADINIHPIGDDHE
jgi:crossover junction endodeoxyribonuclease RusA